MSNDEFIKGWLQSETAEQDKIMVKRIYIDINDGYLADGIMFSQIMYWFGLGKNGKPRVQVERDGHLWLVRKDDDWWGECRVAARAARDSIDRMVKRELIIKARYKWDGAPTTHLRPEWQTFKTAIRNLQFSSNGTDGKGQMELTDSVKSLELTEKVKSLTESDTTTKTSTRKRGKPSVVRPYEDIPQDTRHALIAAWLKALPLPPANSPYTTHENQQTARDLHCAGYTPDQVTAYVTALYQDEWWKDKHVRLQKVAENLPAWVNAQTPAAPVQTKSIRDEIQHMELNEMYQKYGRNHPQVMLEIARRQQLSSEGKLS